MNEELIKVDIQISHAEEDKDQLKYWIKTGTGPANNDELEKDLKQVTKHIAELKKEKRRLMKIWDGVEHEPR